MLHEKSCGAVLFTVEKGIRKFLLVESNYFGLPKGHIEENETEQETALREIKEETGVDAKIIPGFRETVNYRLPNGNVKEVVFFIAEYAPQQYTVNRTELRGITLLTYDKAIKRINVSRHTQRAQRCKRVAQTARILTDRKNSRKMQFNTKFSKKPLFTYSFR